MSSFRGGRNHAVMVLGLMSGGLAIAVCRTSSEMEQEEGVGGESLLPPQAPPEDATPQVLTNGFTEEEWGLATKYFDERLAETPEEKRDAIIRPGDPSEMTPRKLVEAVRNKTEIGARIVERMLVQTMLAELGLG